MIEPAADSQSDTSSANRLVIRIHLTSPEPPEPPEPPAPKRLSRRALLLPILGVATVLLGWLAISIFRSDPAPSVARAPVASDAPISKPAAETSVRSSSEASSDEPEVRPPPEAPLAPINEVIPDVPQSALDTIWGTVRVAIRVTIDKQGSVIDAVTDDAGPSRYFERLSLEASRKWTFTPATSEEPRTALLKFHYTRDAATAHHVTPSTPHGT